MTEHILGIKRSFPSDYWKGIGVNAIFEEKVRAVARPSMLLICIICNIWSRRATRAVACFRRVFENGSNRKNSRSLRL
jgi:hypothetical protein